MLAILPIELQLRILALAIPPFDFEHKRERTEACQLLSLVHRSWAAEAQRLLRQHFYAGIGIRPGALLDDYVRLERRLNRFEVAGGRARDVILSLRVVVYFSQDKDVFLPLFKEIRKLWIQCTAQHTEDEILELFPRSLRTRLQELTLFEVTLDEGSTTSRPDPQGPIRLKQLRKLALYDSSLLSKRLFYLKKWAPRLQTLVSCIGKPGLTRASLAYLPDSLEIATFICKGASIKTIPPTSLPSSLRILRVVLLPESALGTAAAQDRASLAELASRLESQLAACPADPALQITVEIGSDDRTAEHLFEQLLDKHAFLA
ncbi:hypothetical protein JCM10908_006941 [Rhodotorula pacifica]|uniref:uncharacterized protein n=1 Tax=Rhodotorula pacifica TaxID=1495444 RepID=UPI00317FDB66